VVAGVILRGESGVVAEVARKAVGATPLGEAALGEALLGEEPPGKASGYSSSGKEAVASKESPSKGDEVAGYSTPGDGSSSRSGRLEDQRDEEEAGQLQKVGAVASEGEPPGSGFGTSRPEGDQTPSVASSGTEPRSQQDQAQPEDQILPEGERTPSGTSSGTEPQPDDQILPAAEDSDWPEPTQGEVRRANAPRHYELLPGAVMGLTIEAIGIYDAPVFDSDSPEALANGVAHVPGTSWPWSNTPQRNVYLAGHRMGYRGTWSRMIFYELDELGEGDRIVLRDRAGRTYEYRVSEVLLADPADAWVMGQVRGRDMVSLQTCTPIPTFEKRLIVRADRI
jgi:sortase A